MRVIKLRKRGIVSEDSCRFVVYDETKTEDRSKRSSEILDRITNDFMQDIVAEMSDESMKLINRSSHGHPHLCYFSIHRDGRITFQFDEEYEYERSEMKFIMRRASEAKRRVQFSPKGKS